MGIPQPNYIVEGTAGDDLINGAYADDPSGDMIDNSDALDGSNDDSVEAGAGDDDVWSGLGDDYVHGEAGNDSIYAGAGNDTVIAGSGTDVVWGGDGDDSLSGGADNDGLIGEAGNDTLDGGTGDDGLDGGAGDDTIEGGAGNDSIRGQTGDDLIDGGDGSDLIWLESNFGNDTIVGGEGGSSDNDFLFSQTITDDLNVTFAGDEAGSYSDGTHTAVFTEIEGIGTGSGDDLIDADAATSQTTIISGTGSDTIHSGSGDDVIYVGSAALPNDGEVDTIVFSDGDGEDTVHDFEAPIDLGGGNFTGNDQLDVSGMTDADGNPVNVLDVTVTDTNGDGGLSIEEMTAKAEQEVSDRATRRAESRMADADTNGDGLLQAAEIAAQMEDRGGRRGPSAERMFERVDADENGSVSAEEYEEARAHMAERGDRGRRGDH